MGAHAPALSRSLVLLHVTLRCMHSYALSTHVLHSAYSSASSGEQPAMPEQTTSYWHSLYFESFVRSSFVNAALLWITKHVTVNSRMIASAITPVRKRSIRASYFLSYSMMQLSVTENHSTMPQQKKQKVTKNI